jgi:hypothetical protein
MMYIISNLFRNNHISNLLSSDNTEVTLHRIKYNICESVNYTYTLFKWTYIVKQMSDINLS